MTDIIWLMSMISLLQNTFLGRPLLWWAQICWFLWFLSCKKLSISLISVVFSFLTIVVILTDILYYILTAFFVDSVILLVVLTVANNINPNVHDIYIYGITILHKLRLCGYYIFKIHTQLAQVSSRDFKLIIWSLLLISFIWISCK